MKITAISPNHTLQQYGYKYTRLIEGKLSKNLRNLIKSAIEYYNSDFYYMIKYDYNKLKQFDAIVFTNPPIMTVYSNTFFNLTNFGSMFTGCAYPFLLVAEAYQIPVITYPAKGSKIFTYLSNKVSGASFTRIEDFSEIVNEIGLTKESSILLVHLEEYFNYYSNADPQKAIRFFKEYHENN